MCLLSYKQKSVYIRLDFTIIGKMAYKIIRIHKKKILFYCLFKNAFRLNIFSKENIYKAQNYYSVGVRRKKMCYVSLFVLNRHLVYSHVFHIHALMMLLSFSAHFLFIVFICLTHICALLPLTCRFFCFQHLWVVNFSINKERMLKFKHILLLLVKS